MHPRAKGRAKAHGARPVQLMMKRRQASKLRKLIGRWQMKAIASGIGTREMQAAGGLWMIMVRMKMKMKYR